MFSALPLSAVSYDEGVQRPNDCHSFTLPLACCKMPSVVLIIQRGNRSPLEPIAFNSDAPMELIYCPECLGMKKLRMLKRRSCACGKSWGYYLDDDLTAEVGGSAVPIAIENDELREAVLKRHVFLDCLLIQSHRAYAVTTGPEMQSRYSALFHEISMDANPALSLQKPYDKRNTALRFYP